MVWTWILCRCAVVKTTLVATAARSGAAVTAREQEIASKPVLTAQMPSNGRIRVVSLATCGQVTRRSQGDHSNVLAFIFCCSADRSVRNKDP